MSFNRRASLAQRGRPPSYGEVRYPAPVGVNFAKSFAQLAPNECVYAYNMTAGEEGLRTRLGTRVWASSIPGNEVRTIIPYRGNTDKLFAVTPNGIYDVTLDNTTAPSAKVSFSTTAGNAGYGVFEQYTNDAGDKDLFYADAENGLFKYDASGDTWALATGLTGVTVANVRFVVSHKERLWFIEADSDKISYLPVGVSAGTVADFQVGSKTGRGGAVIAAYSWTLDSGQGLDDYFVIASRGGDILVYEGTNPASAADWVLRGRFPLAEFPAGPNVGTQVGGDLYLLTVYGVISISDVLRGTDLTTNYFRGPAAAVTPLVRSQMGLDSDKFGWSLNYLPSTGLFQIQQPPTTRGNPIDNLLLNMNLAVRGWTFWRDLSVYSIDEFDDNVFIGDGSGNVWLLAGGSDGAANDGTGGSAVEFELLTSFQDVGPPGRQIIPSVMRPQFYTEGVTPNFAVASKFDYDISTTTKSQRGGGSLGASWDAALWDAALWGSGEAPSASLRGSSGLGRRVALVLKGSTLAPVTLLHIDLMFTTGGSM